MGTGRPPAAHLRQALESGQQAAGEMRACQIGLKGRNAQSPGSRQGLDPLPHHYAERAFDAVPDLIAVVDTDYRIVRVNRAMAARLGLDPEECVGKVCYRLIHGSQQPPATCPHSKTLEDGREHTAEVNEPKLRSDFLVSTSPLFDAAGRLTGSVHVARDITRRRETELALRHSEAKYRTIFENSPEMIVLLDAEGRFVEANGRAEEWTGYTREEVRGRHFSELPFWSKKDQAKLAETFARRIRGEDIPPYELEFTARDGRKHVGRLNGTVLKDESGEPTHFLAMVSDVTDLREAEQSLRQREMELAHLGRVANLGEMVAALAHELNQPLQAISNYANGMFRRLGRMAAPPPEFVDVTAEIGAEARRASKIIGRVRNYLRKREMRMSTVDPSDVVRDVLPLLESDARNGRVAIELLLTENLPRVAADTVQLQQVVLNLAHNALAALAGVEPHERRLSFATHRAEEEGFVEVAVRDNGIGFAAGAAEQIFDAFYTTKAGGLGMGLAICRSIVETHGGTIWAEPASPHGAVFRFTLPILDREIP